MSDESKPSAQKSEQPLNKENAIRVTINGSTEKFFDKDWLEGAGRGAKTMLSKALLGTEEGFSECHELQLDQAFVGVVDMLILWLSSGDEYLKKSLTEENASELFSLAEYFGISRLEEAISTEQTRREEEERDRLAEEERERLEDEYNYFYDRYENWDNNSNSS